MTETLSSPVYEVKKESEWYRQMKEMKEKQKEFFTKINEEYFEDNGFSYYHSEYFGVQADSKDYEKYKDEVVKNPKDNGFHAFKKRSKYYPIFREMLKEIPERDPFKSHDVLGLNNISGSQWIGDRWFFGVKHEKYVKGDEVEPVAYKEYLKAVMDVMDN